MRVLISGNIASVGYYLCKGLRAHQIKADLVYQRTSGIQEGTKEDWITTYQHPLFKSGKPIFEENKTEYDRVKKKAMTIIPKFKNRIQYLMLPGIDLEKYDLFHLNYLGERLNVGIALRHKLNSWNKPIIVYLHGYTTPTIAKGRQGLRNYIITHHAKLLLFGHPYLYDRLQNYEHEKILLPIPIDTDQFNRIDNEIFSNRILCWVKLERAKRIEFIFKTAKLLPEYQFDVLYGGYISPDSEYYKRIKPKNVKLIPGVPHEQAPELINKYPLIIGQFSVGGYGASELEAMACGKPVIAWWKREYDRFFDGPCPILSSLDPKELAEFVITHIDDKKLGKLNRDWVVKYHSIENVTNKLLKIYKRVMK